MKNLKGYICLLVVFISMIVIASCTTPTTAPLPSSEPVQETEAPAQASGAPGSEMVGKIQANYNFVEGTVLLTPQPDMVSKLVLKPDYKASKDLKIVYITKHLLNPYFVAGAKGVEARCKELGITCEVLAPEKPDNPEEQIRMIEDAVNKKADGILVYAVEF